MSIYWRERKQDGVLDGGDNESGDASVDDTGTYSEVICLSGTVGILLLAEATFPDPATDNCAVEVYESDDNVTYTKNASYDTTITKDAGATVREVVNVDTAAKFIKVLMKSAGATDTPVARLMYEKKSNEPM